MENKTIKTEEEIGLEITQKFVDEYKKLVEKYQRWFTPIVNMGVAKPNPQQETSQPEKK